MDIDFTSPLLDIPRVFVFAWGFVEATILWYLYSRGYELMKKTPIIGSLKNFFFFLSIMFFYWLLISITHILNNNYSHLLTGLSVIPAIGVIYGLIQFRVWSMKKTKTNK